MMFICFEAELKQSFSYNVVYDNVQRCKDLKKLNSFPIILKRTS